MLKNDLVSGAKGASEYTGLPIRTIYHLSERGLLPVIKKGKSLYFLKSDLDAAFRSGAGNG
ncbi:helix-turn-helix domain-containing protein [Sphingobium tyrosinilyticum]|uniref:Helix-turn-helix domain-containing protein n=1 Tax=Sphingobium tyrosinilyticum TaxID=2715436 RepID=A0ABV9EXG3_9SPHN